MPLFIRHMWPLFECLAPKGPVQLLPGPSLCCYQVTMCVVVGVMRIHGGDRKTIQCLVMKSEQGLVWGSAEAKNNREIE